MIPNKQDDHKGVLAILLDPFCMRQERWTSSRGSPNLQCWLDKLRDGMITLIIQSGFINTEVANLKFVSL